MVNITEQNDANNRLICSNPRIKHIWQWGALSPNKPTGTIIHKLSILLDDDTREDFDLTNNYMNGIREAEKWLNQLK